jgi:cell division protein FtsZ
VPRFISDDVPAQEETAQQSLEVPRIFDEAPPRRRIDDDLDVPDFLK